MPIAQQTWWGLGHSLYPFRKNGKQPHTQMNLTSLSHTMHSQTRYFWLVLLKGQQSYFLLLALTLHTWLAELLLTHAGYSFSQATRFTFCQAVSGTHPQQVPVVLRPLGTQDETP